VKSAPQLSCEMWSKSLTRIKFPSIEGNCGATTIQHTTYKTGRELEEYVSIIIFQTNCVYNFDRGIDSNGSHKSDMQLTAEL